MYHPNSSTPPRPRPWSPDPADTLPSLHSLQQNDNRFPSRHHSSRPQAEDPSVDALDLADYANTLHRNAGPSYSYPHPHRPYLEYPPSPPPTRPFSVASRDSLQAPSLTSSPDTLSSQSPIPSYPSRSRSHRPFSLPPSIPTASYPSIRTPPDQSPYSPIFADSRPSFDRLPDDPSAPRSEIDIGHFPAWSRSWYANGAKGIRSSKQDLEQPAFFDPTFSPDDFSPRYSSGQFDPLTGASHASSRDVLPWSNADPYDRGMPLDGELKEERMRMLEREFGANSVGRVSGKEEDAENVVGSVDAKGKLVTQGPKKRLAVRVLEVILTLAIAASSIYGALGIKPTKQPPPQGKPSTYALYVLSVITFLVAIWLFLFRPWCCAGRRKPVGPMGGGPAGLAVLPVQGFNGGKQKKKKGGKKGMHGPADVQVNLIVDPSMFMPGHRGADEADTADEDESAALTSSHRSRPPKRRGIFEGLALEEQWKRARKELKWYMFFDLVCLLLWAIEFVWILMGEKCPPGDFEGWCNSYNVASAGACLLAVAFGVSIFFDVKDLHQSKLSPRTRP
ncbi:hypothetical protein OF83DRAFT_1169624 [Amylostereum chailletii]|nr:hypothetical protein OF83DRAFT_1169624 [Amylostereum chailletii]